ncbi:hypothetical protein [Xylella fastidiosa]|uniref:hypothetical protein n=1 Tax=Xylella fastidiosa TaxID=2371 RepID=UPI0039854507
MTTGTAAMSTSGASAKRHTTPTLFFRSTPMGTQALTHQMIAREAAKMLVEQNNVVTNINTERSKEFGEEINGSKKEIP